MSLWTRINRFNGGLWSPLLHGRTDLEDYNSSLKTCTGFIPLKYGPAERMWGFEYAAEAKTSSSILLPFKFSQSVNYIMETDGTYMRFFDSSQNTIGNAQVTVDIGDVSAWQASKTYRYGELVSNGGVVYAFDTLGGGDSDGTFTAGNWHALTETETTGTFIYEIPLPMSQFTSYLDYPMRAQVNDVVYLVNENYEPLTLSRYGPTDWRIEQIEFTLPPVILSLIHI